MPPIFSEIDKVKIRKRLLEIGLSVIKTKGFKKMSIDEVVKECGIAKGTFYHFFESKETYVSALIEEQEKVWKEQMISGVKSYGKLTLEQAVRIFRESFRKENNILMEFTLDDWVWLKSHRTKDGLFSKEHDELEVQQYLACIDGIRPDLDIRIIINFFKTIYSMAQNRDTFIDEVFETNVDMIFECIYNYMVIQDEK